MSSPLLLIFFGKEIRKTKTEPNRIKSNPICLWSQRSPVVWLCPELNVMLLGWHTPNPGAPSPAISCMSQSLSPHGDRRVSPHLLRNWECWSWSGSVSQSRCWPCSGRAGGKRPGERQEVGWASARSSAFAVWFSRGGSNEPTSIVEVLKTSVTSNYPLSPWEEAFCTRRRTCRTSLFQHSVRRFSPNIDDWKQPSSRSSAPLPALGRTGTPENPHHGQHRCNPRGIPVLEKT